MDDLIVVSNPSTNEVELIETSIKVLEKVSGVKFKLWRTKEYYAIRSFDNMMLVFNPAKGLFTSLRKAETAFEEAIAKVIEDKGKPDFELDTDDKTLAQLGVKEVYEFDLVKFRAPKGLKEWEFTEIVAKFYDYSGKTITSKNLQYK